MIDEYDIEFMVDYNYKFTTIQRILKEQVSMNTKFHRLIDYLDL